MRQTLFKLLSPGPVRSTAVKMSRAVFGWPPRAATFPEKTAAIVNVARERGITNLIETGTFEGDMIEAQRENFNKIITIELSEQLCERARLRFSSYGHITVLHGDSGTMLSEAMRRIEGSAVFWLDAHYSGGVTAEGNAEAPVLKELSMIAARGNKGDAILIDDARLFGRDVGYPKLVAVREFVAQHFPNYAFTIELDAIRIIPQL